MDAATKTTGRIRHGTGASRLASSPLKQKEIWASGFHATHHRTRERALFKLAIDSKLRACDLVAIRVHDGPRQS